MIPDFVSDAFPYFVGKELQVVYAIDTYTSDGVCVASIAQLANIACLNDGTVSKLLQNLELLRIIDVERRPGKNSRIRFGNVENVRKACLAKMESVAVKRRGQTEKARKMRAMFNNRGCSTTGVVKHSGLNNNKNNKKEEKKKRRYEESYCEVVFQVYVQYSWAIQKVWQPKFIAKDSIREHCQVLCENQCVGEYFEWVHAKLGEIEKTTGKNYKRYFATMLADTWFFEFFEKRQKLL